MSDESTIDQSAQPKHSIGHALSDLWLRQRELNILPRRPFLEDEMLGFLYRHMRPVGGWPSEGLMDVRSGHGGIFGLNYSPDGSILGVACENKCLVFMDPLNRRAIRTVENAHTDCVNSVLFLDNRLFTSCSDDHTVKLWDFRFIKDRQAIRVFRGHSNWVKDMEYMPNEGVLLTAGFDNAVYAWDINRYSENPGEEYKRIFYTPGLIRMCMTKDLSKMIISTQWGYLFVVHNFDLNTFADDLRDFKPNIWWLMLNSADMATPPEVRETYLRHFDASRNRTEMIADFPQDNDPQNITSIIAHPFGWCVLSRNVSASEESEWTCVHDIQLPTVDELVETEHSTLPEISSAPSPSSDTPSEDSASTSQDQDRGGFTARSDNVELHLASFWTSSRHRFRGRRTARMSIGGLGVTAAVTRRLSRTAGFHSGLPSARQSGSTSGPKPGDRGPKTHHRLTHYIEEPNVGSGFIKVQSFSFDGRIIASPFGFGVRLLAFDDKCSELSQVSPLRRYEPSVWSTKKKREIEQSTRMDETSVAKGIGNKDDESKTIKERKKIDAEPVKLQEIGTLIGHASPVLCAEFSPTHHLLATGCYNGKIAFHEPVLL